MLPLLGNLAFFTNMMNARNTFQDRPPNAGNPKGPWALSNRAEAELNNKAQKSAIMVTNDNYKSASHPGMKTGGLTGPRKPSGSVPWVPLKRLAYSSFYSLNF